MRMSFFWMAVRKACIAAAGCAALVVILAVSLFADEIRLKNGGKISGIIKRQTASAIDVFTGFGTMTIAAAQVQSVRKGDAAENQELAAGWEASRGEFVGRKDEWQQEREERFRKKKEIADEERAKRSAGAHITPGVVRLFKSERTKDCLVEVVLDGQTKATLVLDTGAKYIIVTKRIGEKHGLDLQPTGSNVSECHLAGRKRPIKFFMMKSVSVSDAVAYDVRVAVLLDDKEILGLYDGLLGLEFLGRFKCKIDLAKLEMTLEKP